MRIRKNTRVLVEENPENQTPFLICKLNRSPWDDDSYFSQLVEEDWDNSLHLNGSLAHSNLVSESNFSGDSMELSFEFVEKQEGLPAPVVVAKLGEEEVREIEAKTTSLWSDQVRKPVSDHLVTCLSTPLGINKGVIAHPPQPPLASTAPPQKKRGRPKKPTQVAAAVDSGGGDGGGNNYPYSFYYYSGFGPSWSKKRGIGSNKSNKNNKYNNNDNNTKRSKKKNNDLRKNDSYNAARTKSLEDDDIRMKEDGNNKSKISVVETVYDEQLDYIDDDFDDEDDRDGGLYGGLRARPRKPIKARSLKSLM